MTRATQSGPLLPRKLCDEANSWSCFRISYAIGLGEGDEKVIDEVFDDRYDDRVAHGIVRLVVGGREVVGARGTHEESCLTWCNEARFPCSGVVEEEKLATAAALGCTKAAREVVESELEDLFAFACAAIARKGGAPVGGELV